MARTHPEYLNNSPASAARTTPGDSLLRDFRATLEARWRQFDAATLESAQLKAPPGVAQIARDRDS